MIAGQPMIEHVWRAAQSLESLSVVVATDDHRIKEVILKAGGEVEMTASDHASGTDRIAEVAIKRGWADDELVVNIQGDEPEINGDLISQLVACAKRHPNAALATMVTPLTALAVKQASDIVKAVRLPNEQVLYFSRAGVPFNRDEPENLTLSYRHLGLYAYRVTALKQFAEQPMSELETIEKLEQLRFLAMGEQIVADVTHAQLSPGIDTPADLAAFEERLANGL